MLNMKLKRTFAVFFLLGVCFLPVVDCFLDVFGRRRRFFAYMRAPGCPSICYRNHRRAHNECPTEEGCTLQPCDRVTEIGRVRDGLSCVEGPSFVHPKPTPSVSPSPRLCSFVPGTTIKCQCNDGAYSEVSWEFVNPHCGNIITSVVRCWPDTKLLECRRGRKEEN
eukprot:TRINITY_DN6245_c0_g2_i1.p2 TRINITY_DN6245_c0_g2~~TRINITY_DN6245_c0_g2_i1.p2  ORF type:complete len:166 (+),score=9.28 TRINITY_DN6245_c0_g2_i1:100-597(+)